MFNITKPVFVILTILVSGCTSYPIIVQCPPDNRPVAIYENSSEAYHDIASGYELSLKGVTGILKDYNAEISLGSLELRENVTALQDKLDQKNILHKNNLKSIAAAQQKDVCDREADKRLISYLAKLSNNKFVLDSMKVLIENKINTGKEEDVLKLIKNVTSKSIIDENNKTDTKSANSDTPEITNIEIEFNKKDSINISSNNPITINSVASSEIVKKKLREIL